MASKHLSQFWGLIRRRKPHKKSFMWHSTDPVARHGSQYSADKYENSSTDLQINTVRERIRTSVKPHCV